MTTDEQELRKKCQEKAYKPTSNDDFIEVMAVAGSLHAAKEDLPLAAMIACACGESTFGTSNHYRATGCPFNLQVPPCWKCELVSDAKAIKECNRKWKVALRTKQNCLKNWKTVIRTTPSKTGQKPGPVPFAAADNLVDAGRLWCEWIKTWPYAPARNALLSLKNNPIAFAAGLHKVGFAESDPAKTKMFGDLVRKHNLQFYDAKKISKTVWGSKS